MGMQVGIASLVMVFSVLCLTILAVLSMISAHNEWELAEKSAQAVTAYYQADSQAVAIYDQLVEGYDGTFTLPDGCDGTITVEQGQTYISYSVPIDTYQQLWVELYTAEGALCVARWEVDDNGTWVADLTLDVWGG